MHDWPTKTKDLLMTKLFIEQYASTMGLDQAVGMIEIITNLQDKRFELKLAPWVTAITLHFQKQYGPDEGEKIARKVLTLCLTQGQIIH
jgi:hypothetical protein